MGTVLKTIVITGASTGIGRATALRLSSHGWRVLAAVRKAEDARSIESDSLGAVETLQLDVGDQDSIVAAASEVETRLDGRGLDALFNNAGIGLIGPIENMAQESLRQIFEVNLYGQIAMIQAFLPLVRKAKGRIVNTGSVGDHVSPPFAGALAASKAAFASMTSALRMELRAQGIHVCLIEPGSINTAAVDKTLGNAESVIAALPRETAGLYREAFQRMVDAFARSERAGSLPEVVAKVVEQALTQRNPKTRYAAGKDSLKLAMLARFLPEKLLDIAILKTFGLPTAFGEQIRPR